SIGAEHFASCSLFSLTGGARYEKTHSTWCFPGAERGAGRADAARSPARVLGGRCRSAFRIDQRAPVPWARFRADAVDDPERSRGIAARLVVADSDTDSPVGINPGRLGPALAPNAGAAIRDCDGTKAGQGSGGVRCHWANTFRRGAVGVGEPEQCCAHRCERTRAGPGDAGGNPGTVGAGMTTGKRRI